MALSDFAVATLLAWQLRQAQEAEAAAEAWHTEGHVFTMEDGRALDPAYVTRLFQTLRKGTGEPAATAQFPRPEALCRLADAGLRCGYRRGVQAARPRIDLDHG